MKLNKKYIIFLLLFLYISTISLNHFVIRNDSTIFTTYEHWTFSESIRVFENTNQALPHHRSPLYYLVTGFFLSNIGKGLSIAFITHYILIIIFIVSNYKLSKLLFNKYIGIISTFFIVSIPLFFGSSRFLEAKFTEIALLPCILYTLLKTDGFSKLKYSILFVIITTLSVSFRITVMIPVLPALIYYTYYKRYNILNNKQNVIIVCFIILLSLLFTFNYLFGIEEMRMWNRGTVNPIETSEALSISTDGIFFYIHKLGVHLLPIYTPIFMISLIYYLYKTKLNKYRFNECFILIILIAQLFILTFIFTGERNVPLILSTLLPISYIVSVSLHDFIIKVSKKIKIDQNILLVLFISIFVVNIFLVTFDIGNYFPEIIEKNTKHITYDYRYNIRQDNDYRKIFEQINDIGSVNITTLIFRKDIYPTVRFWPLNAQGLENTPNFVF